MTNEQILTEFREKFTETPHHKNAIVVAVASWEIEEFLLSHLEAARQEGRDEAVKIVRKSRTTDEVYGIGAAEQTARYQAIVDILAARSPRV